MKDHDEIYAKANCAALAFHKSLMGLAELSALETAASKMNFSPFLQGRAVFTYYVAYHLFTACMLLAPEALFKEPLEAPDKYGKVTLEELNASSEAPAQWDVCTKIEKDWAANIRHWQIKDFCDKVREFIPKQGEEYIPYIGALYRHFIGPSDVEGACIPGLLEKLCYVRDRVIYRPTFIETPSDGQVQTSAQLHEELTSLPNSKVLYTAISETYTGIMRVMEKERIERAASRSCGLMLSSMWTGVVSDDIDDLCGLGHKRRRVQLLGQRDPYTGIYYFPTYICHLLEVESIDFILKYRKKYWRPLEAMYFEDHRAWLKQQGYTTC